MSSIERLEVALKIEDRPWTTMEAAIEAHKKLPQSF